MSDESIVALTWRERLKETTLDDCAVGAAAWQGVETTLRVLGITHMTVALESSGVSVGVRVERDGRPEFAAARGLTLVEAVATAVERIRARLVRLEGLPSDGAP